MGCGGEKWDELGDVTHGGGTLEGAHGAVANLDPAADGAFGHVVGTVQPEESSTVARTVPFFVCSVTHE